MFNIYNKKTMALINSLNKTPLGQAASTPQKYDGKGKINPKSLTGSELDQSRPPKKYLDNLPK